MPAKKLPEIIVFAGPNGRGNAWKVYQRTQKFYLWNSAFYRQESEIIKKGKSWRILYSMYLCPNLWFKH